MSFFSAVDGIKHTSDPTLVSSQSNTLESITEWKRLQSPLLDDNGIYYPKQGVSAAGTFQTATTLTYFQYIGRMKRLWSNVQMRCNVTTAGAGTQTFAEFCMFSGILTALGTPVALFRLNGTGTLPSLTTTGIKNTTISGLTGYGVLGDDLWIGLSVSMATTQPTFTATNPDIMSNAIACSATGRASTIASPTTPASLATAIPAMTVRFS